MAAVSVLDVSFKLLFKKSVTILPLPTVDKRAILLVLLATMSKIEHFLKFFINLKDKEKIRLSSFAFLWALVKLDVFLKLLMICVVCEFFPSFPTSLCKSQFSITNLYSNKYMYNKTLNLQEDRKYYFSICYLTFNCA